MLLEQVMHIHPADAQQFAHVVPAQLAYLPCETEQGGAIAPGLGTETRRQASQHRPKRVCESAHSRRVSVVRARIRANRS